MAATRGNSAWEKYYQGKGDIETEIKENTTAYDVLNRNKQIGSLLRGITVKVLATKEYDSRPIVEYTDGIETYSVRVKFASLEKPTRRFTSKGLEKIRVVRDKSLTPSALGLQGKVITKNDYVNLVKTQIEKNNSIAPHIKIFLAEFLDKSFDTRQKLSEIVDGISIEDLKVIEKDFGEISGAWWFLNNYDKELEKIEFPQSSSAALIDYFLLYKNNIRLKVSAKARQGSAPSLQNIYNIIKGKNFSYAERDPAEFIERIAINNGREGIVAASKCYMSKAYLIAANLIGDKNLTDDKIEKALASFNSPENLYGFLDSYYYSKIGRKASLDSFTAIYRMKKRRSGLITSPMAYSLVDEVNNNRNYTDFLTRICNSENIQQLYLRINKATKKIDYQVKEFKENKFIFEYHSNAKEPGQNKIGFKLIR
jgi:hypothetical protein